MYEPNDFQTTPHGYEKKKKIVDRGSSRRSLSVQEPFPGATGTIKNRFDIDFAAQAINGVKPESICLKCPHTCRKRVDRVLCSL
jgi:hypothetical protein